ncbi:hypothetical protein KGQ20_12020 [Catenulispora sp. NF23]|uniref:Secreted protein n=1 Tax=Catenulispora pinistramenti TaxID=2705254 RepID=A0ABS5KQ37_9ACTN|nr:hypothetical protein [Catenulispora pinistramenti]MBS2533499.1 hypothetical protein [Catenulispora pinistramenti]MBS2548149.1 hypothetical protein [Catenulispora pinistramenti]
MNSWINLTALWKIVVIGLLMGAGLPALFAVGLRALVPRGGTADPAQAGAEAGTGATTSPALLGKLIAALCFAAILAAMAWGIYSIVHNS